MGDWEDDDWEENAQTKAPDPKKKNNDDDELDESSEAEEEEPAPKAKAEKKSDFTPPSRASPSKANSSKTKGKAKDVDDWEQSSEEETGRGPPEPEEKPVENVERKVIAKDSMKELELNLQSHVDSLVKMITPKLTNAQAKKAPSKFLKDSLTGLQGKLTLQEVDALLKISKEITTRRKKEQQEKEKQEKIEQAKKEEEEKKKALGENEVADEEFFADFM